MSVVKIIKRTVQINRLMYFMCRVISQVRQIHFCQFRCVQKHFAYLGRICVVVRCPEDEPLAAVLLCPRGQVVNGVAQVPHHLPAHSILEGGVIETNLAMEKCSLCSTKVVLIDKVVLGGRKKGNGNEPYFWVQNLWVHRLARPFPISWIWPG